MGCISPYRMEIKLNNSTFDLLGIEFSVTLDEMSRLNYELKLAD